MKRVTVITISLIAILGLLAAGCATAPKGPTDEQLVSKRMQEGIAAIKAKDWKAFDGMVSASFSSSAVGDKSALLDYLKNADSSGFLDRIEIDISGAKTTLQGDKATVAPVVANGSFGSITLNFTGIKEKGVWLINDVEPGY